MGRCKDCKWARVALPNIEHRKYLTCDSPKLLKGYSHMPSNVAPDGALVENDEGWAIVVGPDFGCVNFEP